MKYALVIITHGDGSTLKDTLATFSEMVIPLPFETIIAHDQGDLGFCRNTQQAWSQARNANVDYVFWLEHDFRFICPIDLKAMARVLDKDPHLAQMALIRAPVSDEEKEAGTWLDYHANALERYVTSEGDPWHRHQVCFTTNPSLIRRRFMVANPWPDYSQECEGHFSGDLRARGYHFGSWGETHQVVHTGQLRTGHGY